MTRSLLNQNKSIRQNGEEFQCLANLYLDENIYIFTLLPMRNTPQCFYQFGHYDPSQQEYRQTLKKYHLNGIFRCFDWVNQLHSQSQMQNLIIILRIFLQQLSEEQNNRPSLSVLSQSQEASSTRSELEGRQEFLKQCQFLKERNIQLLIDVLNLRDKLVHQIFMSEQTPESNKRLFCRINDKIIDLKKQVGVKYRKIKQKRNITAAESPIKSHEEQICPKNIKVLENISSWTTILKQESAQNKEELDSLTNYLHSLQI